jgi:hypothetical protein
MIKNKPNICDIRRIKLYGIIVKYSLRITGVIPSTNRIYKGNNILLIKK